MDSAWANNQRDCQNFELDKWVRDAVYILRVFGVAHELNNPQWAPDLIQQLMLGEKNREKIAFHSLAKDKHMIQSHNQDVLVAYQLL